MCKVSVLMPVYNGERHLKKAIESILTQSFTDFELLILIEHGSSEESIRIVNSFEDKRIRIINNKKRFGLPESLNKGIRLSQGKYIARMDADDIAYKDRLKIQVSFLDKHKDIDLIGSNAKINGHFYHRTNMPYSTEEIRFVSFFRASFIHPTVMWRKESFNSTEMIYKNLEAAEDYELWSRIVYNHKAVNIKKPLIFYRVDGTGKSFSNKGEIPTYLINKELFERFGLNYDLDGWVFDFEEGNNQFFHRLELVESVISLFDFKDIEKVFMTELCKLFVMYGYYNPNDFWIRYGHYYGRNKYFHVIKCFVLEYFKQRIKGGEN